MCAMRCDGITGDLWTIPPEHFKGKRTHVVPLPNEGFRSHRRAEADGWLAAILAHVADTVLGHKEANPGFDEVHRGPGPLTPI